MFNLLGFAAQVCALVSIAAIVISCVSLPQQIIGYEFEMSNSFNGEPCSWDDPRLQYQSFDDSESDATLPMTTSHCAKSMTTPAIVTTVYNTVNSAEYNAMTVKQLKAFCRSNGIKGYSNLRKTELIRLVEECYLPW